LKEAAQSDKNLMPFFIEAAKEYATLGEICGTLKEVFGEYREPSF
jgi:methylmalonyl-CoA mutase N-terminal domain/subunit